MSMIRPPHFVQRHPQGVDELAYWKATEFRSFLFYYSSFVLCGILPKDSFDNFLLFVEGVALLNSGSITPEGIVLAEMLLDKFVRDFEILYGLRHMSHNIHMVLHLGSCVRNLGPLFVSSCFKFEDMNGTVLNFVHCSRHAALQIHSKLNIIKDLPLKIHNMNEGPAKTHRKKLDNDKSWVLNELVTSRIIMHPNVLSVRVYHRFMKGKLLYVSRSYGRGHCDSSFAKYCVNGVMLSGRIEFFIKVKVCGCFEYSCNCNKKHLAVVRTMSREIAFRSNICQVQHVSRCKLKNSVNLVDPSSLQSVLINVGLKDDYLYISDLLNLFELE
ncbi:hypothetical protein FOCC_FOCC015244 [Frankliniella occidentalis]|nr:hypothetical protein FOCC_FOCC015244 [Frankliniella occidentalis]